MSTYVLNSVVKISMMFAKYFEYYIIILRGSVFCGHTVHVQGLTKVTGCWRLQCKLYDTICLACGGKLTVCQFGLPHGAVTEKNDERKNREQKPMCTEDPVRVSPWRQSWRGNRVYDGKDLCNRCVLSQEWNTERVMFDGMREWRICELQTVITLLNVYHILFVFQWLWSPYGIRQTIIFLSCGFFFFSSPNLSNQRLDVYHTSTHAVALVRI